MNQIYRKKKEAELKEAMKPIVSQPAIIQPKDNSSQPKPMPLWKAADPLNGAPSLLSLMKSIPRGSKIIGYKLPPK